MEHGFTKEEDGVGILLKGRKEKLLNVLAKGFLEVVMYIAEHLAVIIGVIIMVILVLKLI